MDASRITLSHELILHRRNAYKLPPPLSPVLQSFNEVQAIGRSCLLLARQLIAYSAQIAVAASELPEYFHFHNIASRYAKFPCQHLAVTLLFPWLTIATESFSLPENTSPGTKSPTSHWWKAMDASSLRILYQQRKLSHTRSLPKQPQYVIHRAHLLTVGFHH